MQRYQARSQGCPWWCWLLLCLLLLLLLLGLLGWFLGWFSDDRHEEAVVVAPVTGGDDNNNDETHVVKTLKCPPGAHFVNGKCLSCPEGTIWDAKKQKCLRRVVTNTTTEDPAPTTEPTTDPAPTGDTKDPAPEPTGDTKDPAP